MRIQQNKRTLTFEFNQWQFIQGDTISNQDCLQESDSVRAKSD